MMFFTRMFFTRLFLTKELDKLLTRLLYKQRFEQKPVFGQETIQICLWEYLTEKLAVRKDESNGKKHRWMVLFPKRGGNLSENSMYD